MTFDFIREAWETPCSSHTQKLVFAALAAYADESGKCWPSIESLCRRCGLSERSVQTQIRALSSLGLLTIHDGGGRHRTNHYELHVNPAPDTLNGKHRIGNTVSDDRNPARRSKNPAQPAPELPRTTKELPGGKAPLPFLSRLERQVERCKSERLKLVRKFAIDNSMDGRTWKNKDAEREFDEWGKNLNETQEIIRKHEYQE